MKCFKCQGLGHYAYECLNQRSMVLRDGEYISESDVEEEEESEYVEEEESQYVEEEETPEKTLAGEAV